MVNKDVLREALREKGQFWTPSWIAEALAEYAMRDSNMLFDPAVGAGAILQAAYIVAQERGVSAKLSGIEIDSEALQQASESLQAIADVEIGDFLRRASKLEITNIAANPPYIRHHRIPAETKSFLKNISTEIIGENLDARAGLHIYFLVLALNRLSTGGRLAFIMPADTCEGIFAKTLWKWITKNYCLDAIITFDPQASPFPKLDTNPIVIFIRNTTPQDDYLWARCHTANTFALRQWVSNDFQTVSDSLTVAQRNIADALSVGLSKPHVEPQTQSIVLGDFVKVVRGVATGENDFFFLTCAQVEALYLPSKFFVAAIGRTRDVPNDEITTETIQNLRDKGRPTQLLCLSGDPLEDYPQSIREYLSQGEQRGLPKKPLISQRSPWYKMEHRIPPPFLFAYLGRRNTRFIRNTAHVIPLTSFLCVYPRQNDEAFIQQLWQVLNHPKTFANLGQIAKTYGNGAMKVEPRALERLPLPEDVVAEANLPFAMRLF